MNANELTTPIADRPLTDRPAPTRPFAAPELESGRHRLDDGSTEYPVSRPTGYTAWAALVGLGCFLVLAMLLITLMWN
ncbi:hypothetical protein ACFU8R_26415 [Pseudonocardia alni]|uniref:hypothetical protein n=1 Tax=Pseudonocardia alni TaxID=33907 RepID=UPI0036A06FC0